MKKINIIIICAVVAVFVGIIGFVIGLNFNGSNSVSGTYKTTTWNGGDAVLVLNKDKTCIYPDGGGTGTWRTEENKLFLEITTTYLNGNAESAKKTFNKEATIVDKGIILSTHFFEKLK